MASSNAIFRLFTEHLGGTQSNNFIGDYGDVWFDPIDGQMRFANGTPGGTTTGGYILPPANTSALGGVIIDNITVVATNNGILSVKPGVFVTNAELYGKVSNSNLWLIGDGVPNANIGFNGDYYVDVANAVEYVLYGKNSNTWVAQESLPNRNGLHVEIIQGAREETTDLGTDALIDFYGNPVNNTNTFPLSMTAAIAAAQIANTISSYIKTEHGLLYISLETADDPTATAIAANLYPGYAVAGDVDTNRWNAVVTEATAAGNVVAFTLRTFDTNSVLYISDAPSGTRDADALEHIMFANTIELFSNGFYGATDVSNKLLIKSADNSRWVAGPNFSSFLFGAQTINSEYYPNTINITTAYDDNNQEWNISLNNDIYVDGVYGSGGKLANMSFTGSGLTFDEATIIQTNQGWLTLVGYAQTNILGEATINPGKAGSVWVAGGVAASPGAVGGDVVIEGGGLGGFSPGDDFGSVYVGANNTLSVIIGSNNTPTTVNGELFAETLINLPGEDIGVYATNGFDVDGNGLNIYIQAGIANTGQAGSEGGDIFVNAGVGYAADGAPGEVVINAGGAAASALKGGDASIVGGQGTGSVAEGGDVTVSGGAAWFANGGSVTITGGSANGRTEGLVHIGETTTSEVHIGNTNVLVTLNGNVFINNVNSGDYATHAEVANAYTNAVTVATELADNAYSNAVTFATGAADNAYSNAVTAATNLADNAYSNAVTFATGAADNAYSNAVTFATGAADNAYSNAVTSAGLLADNAYSNAVTFATGASDNAYSNAIAVAALLADNAYSNALASANGSAFDAYTNAVAAAVLLSDNAYSNAVTFATGAADNAYSNAVSTAGLLADNAYSNAVTFATGAADNAYSNAVSTAGLLADNAYSNAVSTAGLLADNAYSNAVSTAGLLADNAYSNAVSTAGLLADNAYSNAVSTAGLLADNAYSNAVSTAGLLADNAYSNAVSTAGLLADNAYSNAVTYADLAAANAYSNAIAYTNSVSINLLSIGSSLIANSDNTYSLGNSTVKWQSLYLSANTLYFDDVAFSVNSTGGIVTAGNVEFANTTAVADAANAAYVNAVAYSNTLAANLVAAGNNITVSYDANLYQWTINSVSQGGNAYANAVAYTNAVVANLISNGTNITATYDANTLQWTINSSAGDSVANGANVNFNQAIFDTVTVNSNITVNGAVVGANVLTLGTPGRQTSIYGTPYFHNAVIEFDNANGAIFQSVTAMSMQPAGDFNAFSRNNGTVQLGGGISVGAVNGSNTNIYGGWTTSDNTNGGDVHVRGGFSSLTTNSYYGDVYIGDQWTSTVHIGNTSANVALVGNVTINGSVPSTGIANGANVNFNRIVADTVTVNNQLFGQTILGLPGGEYGGPLAIGGGAGLRIGGQLSLQAGFANVSATDGQGGLLYLSGGNGGGAGGGDIVITGGDATAYPSGQGGDITVLGGSSANGIQAGSITINGKDADFNPNAANSDINIGTRGTANVNIGGASANVNLVGNVTINGVSIGTGLLANGANANFNELVVNKLTSNVSINLASNAYVSFGAYGADIAAPSLTNTNGTRINLFDLHSTDANLYSYAIGIGQDKMWFGVDQNANTVAGFAWYEQNNVVMELGRDGHLTVANQITINTSNVVTVNTLANSTAVGVVSVDGNTIVANATGGISANIAPSFSNGQSIYVNNINAISMNTRDIRPQTVTTANGNIPGATLTLQGGIVTGDPYQNGGDVNVIGGDASGSGAGTGSHGGYSRLVGGFGPNIGGSAEVVGGSTGSQVGGAQTYAGPVVIRGGTKSTGFSTVYGGAVSIDGGAGASGGSSGAINIGTNIVTTTSIGMAGADVLLVGTNVKVNNSAIVTANTIANSTSVGVVSVDGVTIVANATGGISANVAPGVANGANVNFNDLVVNTLQVNTSINSFAISNPNSSLVVVANLFMFDTDRVGIIAVDGTSVWTVAGASNGGIGIYGGDKYDGGGDVNIQGGYNFNTTGPANGGNVQITGGSANLALGGSNGDVSIGGSITSNVNIGNTGVNINLKGQVSINANGSVGTAGQVLTSNGSTTYWSNVIANGANANFNQLTVDTLQSNNGVTINNNRNINFQTLNSTAFVALGQQSDDNLVLYSTNTTGGQRAVWSVFANSDASLFNISVPVNADDIQTSNINIGISGELSIGRNGNTTIGVANTWGIKVSNTVVEVSSNIIPSANLTYSLGNTTNRWESLWVGSNSIIFSDQNNTYPDQKLTLANGVFYISGANTTAQSNAGFRVGNFLLQNNNISLTNSSAEFFIGTDLATGNLVINRPMVIYATGTNTQPTFAVGRNGQVEIHTPNTILTNASAVSIIGSNSGVAQPRNYTGTLLQATAQDGQPARISLDAFGANTYASIAGRGARGTVTAPAQTQANDTIVRLTMQGWTGDSNTYAGTIGRINMMAAENFYAANTGTKIVFQLTPTGSNTIQSETVAFYANGISLAGNPNSGITFADGTRQTTAASPVQNFGSFYSNTDQFATVANTAYAVALNNTNHANGITAAANGLLTVADAGFYQIQYNGQVANPDGGPHDVSVWIRKNGVDIAYSEYLYTVPSSHAGTNGKLAISGNYTDLLAANDTIQVMWATPQSNQIYLNASLPNTAPTQPGSSSAGITMFRVA